MGRDLSNGDVIFKSVGGDFTVEAMGGSAHVGPTGNASAALTIATGNVRIDQVGGTPRVIGGTQRMSGAEIGYGFSLSGTK